MFFVTEASYVIRCYIGFLVARIIGIKSSASSEIIMRAVSFEGLHRSYSTARYRWHCLAQPITRDIDGLYKLTRKLSFGICFPSLIIRMNSAETYSCDIVQQTLYFWLMIVRARTSKMCFYPCPPTRSPVLTKRTTAGCRPGNGEPGSVSAFALGVPARLGTQLLTPALLLLALSYEYGLPCCWQLVSAHSAPLWNFQFRGRRVSDGTRLGAFHYSVQLLKSLALWMLKNSEIGFSLATFHEELHIFPLRVRPAAEICPLCKIQRGRSVPKASTRGVRNQYGKSRRYCSLLDR